MTAITFDIKRNLQHPVSGEPGWDTLTAEAAVREDLEKFAVKAFDSHWHICAWHDASETGALYKVVLFKPHERKMAWQEESIVIAGESAANIRREISSILFARRTQERIAMGEVYVYCHDCGGKLYSDDARPGETTDRSIPCPKRRNGKCGYDS